MSPIQSIRAVLVCGALSFLPAADAALIDFETSGTWRNPGGVFGFEGGGTNAIFWGRPLTSNGKSGWRFDGNSGQVDPLDGGLVRLGTFTHNNFVIRRFNFLGTTLDFTLTLDGVDLDLALDFTHLETPNDGDPCAAGGAQPCPDLVTFPSVDTPFSANGRDYRLTGFFNLEGVQVNSFLTLEERVNQAELYARIVDETRPPLSTPEPGTLMLFGAGCLLFARLRKRSED